jgi:hypothetical protein
MDATQQRMLALDPADPLVIYFAAYHFARARQPLDALKVIEYARTVFPPLYAAGRGYILLDFAGRTEELRTFLERYAPADDPGLLSDSLVDYFLLLRFEHRYTQLRAQIDRERAASKRYLTGIEFGPVGQTPTAFFRGWTDLLLGDRAGASKDGRAVLRFVERQTRTEWNGAHLEVLAAAGHAFAGECERARSAGKNALALIPRADNAVVWNRTAMTVAWVDAWCGGQDDAVALVRQLAAGRPGIGPAQITRDPLLTVPLDHSPAYRALADQLELAMRATRLQ